ncbi:MAG: hypothetical protein WC773_03485 [Patescibacteria group bacterium]|jgi:hypothetical protein
MADDNDKKPIESDLGQVFAFKNDIRWYASAFGIAVILIAIAFVAKDYLLISPWITVAAITVCLIALIAHGLQQKK